MAEMARRRRRVRHTGQDQTPRDGSPVDDKPDGGTSGSGVARTQGVPLDGPGAGSPRERGLPAPPRGKAGTPGRAAQGPPGEAQAHGRSAQRGGGRGAGEPADDERDGERGLRGLVGGGSSQVSVPAALRARDATRPTAADLAASERDLVIVRRHWTPPPPARSDTLPRSGRAIGHGR